MEKERLKRFINEVQNSSVKKNFPFMPPPKEKASIVAWIQSYFNERDERITLSDAKEIADYLIGLGPMQQFYENPRISEVIAQNGIIRVEEEGIIKNTGIQIDDETAERILKNLAIATGTKFGTARPLLSTQIPNSFDRVLGMIPPITIHPQINIRKHMETAYSIADLIDRKMLSIEMADFLEEMIKIKTNILITGIGSAGKTTLADALLQLVPEDSIVAVVEDVRELHPKKVNFTSMVALHRKSSSEEEPEEVVDVATLINMVGTRIHANRVILGEIRTGDEANQFLNTIGIGSDGVITTIHSSTPKGAVERLETLSLSATKNFSEQALKERIGSNLDVIVQLAMIRDRFRIVERIDFLHLNKNRDYAFTPVYKAVINKVEENNIDVTFRSLFNVDLLPEKIVNRFERYYGNKWKEKSPFIKAKLDEEKEVLIK